MPLASTLYYNGKKSPNAFIKLGSQILFGGTAIRQKALRYAVADTVNTFARAEVKDQLKATLGIKVGQIIKRLPRIKARHVKQTSTLTIGTVIALTGKRIHPKYFKGTTWSRGGMRVRGKRIERTFIGKIPKYSSEWRGYYERYGWGVVKTSREFMRDKKIDWPIMQRTQRGRSFRKAIDAYYDWQADALKVYESLGAHPTEYLNRRMDYWVNRFGG